MDNKFVIPGTILAGALIIAVAVVYGGDIKERLQSKSAPNTAPVVEVPIGNSDHIRGNTNAPITIVEYSDLECPFCKTFHATMKQTLIEYGDQVRWIFKHFPLDQRHPKADKEAEAAECAHEQGKFWEFHDQIYQNQGRMGAALYTEIAQKLGLDMDKFNSCVETGKYRAEIQEDFSQGSQAGISGTPGFLINGIPLIGAHPFQNFQQVIEAELAN